MHTFPATPTVNLLRRQALQVRASKGERIECRSGQIWVTQDGDPRDVILAANQCFILDRSGPVVVSALEDSAFVHRGRQLPRASVQLRASDQPAVLPSCAY